MKNKYLTNQVFNRFFLFLAFSIFVLYSNAQVTTSSIFGVVTGNGVETLPGASVVAVHTPTGTQYGTITDADGNFRIPNMSVGGPYKINVSYVGYKTYTRTDVFLSLAQPLKFSVNMNSSDSMLKGVEIVGNRYDPFDGSHTGSETNVGSTSIERMPSIGRNFSDYTRLTPQAKVTQSGGVEVAGTNNRYNSIFIDGAVNNDVFGLTDQGTNGGQTGISPFSMDIIDQVSIQVAPYDVKLGGFAGAGINAVTRRGTNEIQGSAYFIHRDEGLAGLTPTDDESVERKKLVDFSSNTYGFRVGGPIIENKLFYFINAEIQKDETPQPFDFSTYNGNASESDLNSLIAKLNSYGYDAGLYNGANKTLEGSKVFARIDWNINKVHRLMVRHQYTKAEQISPSNSGITAIRFANSGIYFPSTTNSTAIELKSNFNSRMSNNLIVGLTFVRDDRDPIGGNFPFVSIKDGTGKIYFGSEEYSTANQLSQNIYTLTDNFEIYKGKHTITIGTHNEMYGMYNLFIRQNFGSYQFNSINDFVNDKKAYQFDRTFSAVDDVTGDGSTAAAEFSALQIGLYIQDEYQVSNKLRLTYGLRADMPMFLDQPKENTDFNDNVIPILEAAGWDLEGAKTGQTPSPKVMLNPRFGFNYDVKGDKTLQIRGGAGLFTSRIPYVWPGASFQNNAVTTGGIRTTTTSGDTNQLYFNPNWNTQASVPPTQPSGQVDIFAKDFKYPKVFRANLAIDKKLPWNLVASVDFTFTKNINNVLYYNLAYRPTDSLSKHLTGSGDERPISEKISLGNDPNTGKSRKYTDIILGTNTKEGYSYNFTAQLQKEMTKGFSGSIAYSYGRAYSMNDGVSSQNSSQWRVANVRGKNSLDLAISDFDMGHRITGFVSYKREYLKHTATTISLFYTGQSGSRYSYGYADGSSKYLGEDNQSLELMYVPKDANDINLVNLISGSDTITPAQQWADLNTFIENDEYLNSRRGQYTERNHSRLPFTNIFDARIAQDFHVNVKGKKNTIQIAFDVFNLGNLINKDWGRIYYSSGAYYNNYPLVKMAGFEADGTTPKYTFTKPKGETYAIDDSGILSSRWQGQITVRYIFN